MKRKYSARIVNTNTWFHYYSEHKAGSNVNVQDAMRAAYRKFGQAYMEEHPHGITDILLVKEF